MTTGKNNEFFILEPQSENTQYMSSKDYVDYQAKEGRRRKKNAFT